MSKSEMARCPACGAELTLDVGAQGLCAACLLKLGLSSTNIPAEEFSPPSPEPKPRVSWTRRWRRGRAALIVAAAMLMIGAGFVSTFLVRRHAPSPSNGVYRFSLDFPGLVDFAVSPDGKRLAFTASNENGKPLLHIHPLDSFHDIVVPETEDAAGPFWSPDSQWIGFFASGKLKKVNVHGGVPETLSDAPTGKAGTWSHGPERVIVFERSANGGLFRVSDRGGTPVATTQVDRSPKIVAHRWPHFLRDGRHFIYTSVSSNPDEDAVWVSSLDNGNTQLIMKGRTRAAYANESLVFVRAGLLMVEPFDDRRFEVSGEARPLRFAEQVGRFSLSANGVAAYRKSEPVRPLRIEGIDRSGKSLGPIGDVTANGQFSISPDGRSIAVSKAGDIWISDLYRGVTSRFTFDAADDSSPIWSPDGTRIVFISNRGGRTTIYEKGVNAAKDEQPLFAGSGVASIDSWSPDGKYIAYTANGERGKSVIGVLPFNEEHKPILVQSAFNLRQPHFSPDGRWLAYVSDESGRDEVYVESFPGRESKWQVSVDGGTEPRWSSGGRELLFAGSARLLMGVAISSGSSLTLTAPHAFFRMPADGSYQVANDGQRLLMSVPEEDEAQTSIHLIINWPEDFRMIN